MNLLKSYLSENYSYFNKAEFLLDGTDYINKVIYLINEAKEYIHIQTYIWKEDEFGKKVIEALMEAAHRKVKIYILLDGFGSNQFPEKIVNQFTTKGIHFAWFNPPSVKNWKTIGRRLHQKVMLFDHQTALVGGINIVSPFENSTVPRLDFAYLIEGEIVEKITIHCEKLFNKSLTKNSAVNFASFPTFIKDENLTNTPMRLRINDWMRGKSEISYSFNKMVNFSNHSILIINSYFLPSSRFLKTLVKLKKERNLDIKIVVPQKSDWQSWQWATAYLYSYLIKHDIQLYEWKLSVLHGKLMICDEEWILMGSYNLNFTSYFGNIELNLETLSSEFSKDVSLSVNKLIESGCTHINPIYQSNSEYNFLHSIRNFIFYLIIKVTAFFAIKIIGKS